MQQGANHENILVLQQSGPAACGGGTVCSCAKLRERPPRIPWRSPDARSVLTAMTSHLSSLKNFSVEYAATDEIVTPEGQKLQFLNAGEVTAQRPGQALRKAPGRSRHFPKCSSKARGSCSTRATPNAYLQLDASSIDGAIEALHKFGFDAPGSDLLSFQASGQFDDRYDQRQPRWDDLHRRCGGSPPCVPRHPCRLARLWVTAERQPAASQICGNDKSRGGLTSVYVADEELERGAKDRGCAILVFATTGRQKARSCLG